MTISELRNLIKKVILNGKSDNNKQLISYLHKNKEDFENIIGKFNLWNREDINTNDEYKIDSLYKPLNYESINF